MHRIEFTGSAEDRKLFVVFWIGWNKGGELQGKEANALGNAITLKLLDLAEDAGPGLSVLRAQGGVLELSPREFRLLRLHCEAAAYPPSLSGDAGRMYEVLEAAAG